MAEHIPRGCPCALRGLCRRSVPLPACLNSPSGCPRQSGVHRIARHAGKQCVLLLPKTSGPIRGRSARILLTAIIPATPLSLGWFGRCSPARPRNRPRPARWTTASPRHGSQGPGGPGCRGRTRCDSLSCGARPVSRHRPWTFSPASVPFGGFRPQYDQWRASGQQGGSHGNAIRASRSGPRSRD